MIDKDNRFPIIDPILLALKSRRVIVALVALIVGLIVLAVPELAAVQGEVLVLLITLALAVIGGYSIEDAASAARIDTATLDDDMRERLKALIDALLDSMGDPPQGRPQG